MICLWLFSLSGSHANPAFKIQGYVDSVGSRRPRVWNFEGTFQGSNSLITIHFPETNIIESGTDGLDSYTVNRLTMVPATDTNTSHFGYVTEGPFPEKNFTPAQIVWLAFGSSHYISGGGKSFPMDVFRDNARAVSATVETLNEVSNLPKNIVWYGPNFFLSEGKSLTISNTYPEGYLAARFNVLSATNWQSLLLPTQFEFLSYTVKSVTSTISGRDDVRLVQTLRATVTNLTSTSIESNAWLPRILRTTTIKDWRFKDQTAGSPVSYDVKEGYWPKRNNRGLLAHVPSYVPIQQPNVRWSYVGALMLALSAPLAIIAWQNLKNKHNKKGPI